MVAMGGNLGLKVDLAEVPRHQVDRDDTLLFSESAGRFIVTVDPARREAFEGSFQGNGWACVGVVTEQPDLVIRGLAKQTILSVPVKDLKAAWKMTFGDLI
jgi:phosphoribosylformylglycinamidine (FGAM) synthase-like enzyme